MLWHKRVSWTTFKRTNWLDGRFNNCSTKPYPHCGRIKSIAPLCPSNPNPLATKKSSTPRATGVCTPIHWSTTLVPVIVVSIVLLPFFDVTEPSTCFHWLLSNPPTASPGSKQSNCCRNRPAVAVVVTTGKEKWWCQVFFFLIL